MLAFSSNQGKFALQLLDTLPGTKILQQELGDLYASMQDEVWSMTAAGSHIYYYRDIPGEGATLCRRKDPEAQEEKILGKVKINGHSYSVRKRLFAHQKSLLALMLVQNGESNPQNKNFQFRKASLFARQYCPCHVQRFTRRVDGVVTRR